MNFEASQKAGPSIFDHIVRATIRQYAASSEPSVHPETNKLNNFDHSERNPELFAESTVRCSCGSESEHTDSCGEKSGSDVESVSDDAEKNSELSPRNRKRSRDRQSAKSKVETREAPSEKSSLDKKMCQGSTSVYSRTQALALYYSIKALHPDNTVALTDVEALFEVHSDNTPAQNALRAILTCLDVTSKHLEVNLPITEQLKDILCLSNNTTIDASSK